MLSPHRHVRSAKLSAKYDAVPTASATPSPFCGAACVAPRGWF
jgi:hypothetical protein